jgi:hypothetical protein
MNTHDKLVNMIDERLLNAQDCYGNNLYHIVKREKVFCDSRTHNTIMEIDNYAIRFGKMHTYLLLFEDKSCTTQQIKAHKQLKREELNAYLIFSKYNMPTPQNLKIYKFYVYNYKNPQIMRV